MDENEVKQSSKSEFINKIKEFSNIILSKTDTLDLLYDIEQEDKFFQDKPTYDILINQTNVEYFYKNLDQMHYIVDMCCLLHIKKQYDTSSTHSPFSFYSFHEMQEYYYNLIFLFKETHNIELPSYFEFIIEWIVLRGEEVDNYNIFINNQIEKMNQMHINTFFNEIKQQAEEFQDNISKSLEDAKANISSVETAIQTNISTAIKSIETTQKDELHNVEKNMIQTSISILGVFAAVVLTFNMGISFAAEALETFMKSGIYHSVLVILLFGFIIGNVIFALFAFLRYIHNKKENEKDKKDDFRNTILWRIVKIFNITLLILFICNLICWRIGIVECRDNDIRSTYYSEQSNQQNVEDTTEAPTIGEIEQETIAQ